MIRNKSKACNYDFSLWFQPNSFQTLAAWVVSNFEKAALDKYFESKKNTTKNTSLYEVLEFKVTLQYKKELIALWDYLDKSKKEKVNIYLHTI